jgi:hypothetical protein
MGKKNKKPKVTTEIIYDSDGTIEGMVRMEHKYGTRVPEGQDPGEKLGLLIALINGFDEFHTSSWCTPDEKEEWNVSFYVERDEIGWDALAFLTHAVFVANADREFDVTLEPWNSAYDDNGFYAFGSLQFSLRGRKCNPAHFAGVIVEQYANLPVADADDD